MRVVGSLLFCCVLGGCSSDDSATEKTGTGGAGGSAGDSAADAPEAPPDGTLPPHASSLPFSYTRPEKGDPVDTATIAAVTDKFIDLLNKTRYFEFIDERVHGWPESDPKAGYWYGTWWSGADVYKNAGQITYHHNSGGGDNNGLRTAQLLEGSCYAFLLWNKPEHEHLFRRLTRGFSSWSLAIVKPGGEPEGALLTRAAYLLNFTDTDRAISVDYSLNRPGDDNGATQYIHIPNNPTFGDIWVKNKRSKDDIGHMLRAVSQVDTCAAAIGGDATADLKQLRRLYVTWARRVEDDGWKIATYDKDLKLWYPTGTLATFSLLGNAECTAALSIRLFGRWSPRDDLNCGNGIGGLDAAISNANDQNGEILRTFHEAAANAALIANQNDLAQKLVTGLAQRIDQILDAIEAGTPPPYVSDENLSDLIIHSANAGVPLTWREVRWLHQKLDVAYAKILDPSNATSLNTKDPATPDGSYLFEPASDGIGFKSLAALLGVCAAQYRNPASKPVFDCEKLKAAQ